MSEMCRFEAPCPRCSTLVWWHVSSDAPYRFTIDCSCTRARRRADRPLTTLDRKLEST